MFSGVFGKARKEALAKLILNKIETGKDEVESIFPLIVRQIRFRFDEHVVEEKKYSLRLGDRRFLIEHDPARDCFNIFASREGCVGPIGRELFMRVTLEGLDVLAYNLQDYVE